MAKKSLYTTQQLFDIINQQLKEENLLPDILDYGLSEHREYPVKTIEWDCIGIVNFGGCEGIYLDLYLYGNTGNDMEKIPLGTYKTLSRSKEAFKAMSVLNAEYVFALNDFVQAHIEDFNWTGYDVYFFKDDQKRVGYTSASLDSAQSLIARNFERYHFDYAILTNNETGREKRIDNAA